MRHDALEIPCSSGCPRQRAPDRLDHHRRPDAAPRVTADRFTILYPSWRCPAVVGSATAVTAAGCHMQVPCASIDSFIEVCVLWDIDDLAWEDAVWVGNLRVCFLQIRQANPEPSSDAA